MFGPSPSSSHFGGGVLGARGGAGEGIERTSPGESQGVIRFAEKLLGTKEERSSCENRASLLWQRSHPSVTATGRHPLPAPWAGCWARAAWQRLLALYMVTWCGSVGWCELHVGLLLPPAPHSSAQERGLPSLGIRRLMSDEAIVCCCGGGRHECPLTKDLCSQRINAVRVRSGKKYPFCD